MKGRLFFAPKFRSSLIFSTFQKNTKIHQGALDGTGGVVIKANYIQGFISTIYFI
jgi:hypothetical protein